MNILAWHVNAWTGQAWDMVKSAPSDLKILNTAIDLDHIREWRQLNPNGMLVYREVFEDGNDEYDTVGRTDRLSRNAEQLLRYGVTVETPWNEQIQERARIERYRDLTLHSISLLRSRGFKSIACGNFSVQWPRLTDLDLFLPAIQQADFYSAHTYDAPTMFSHWEDNIGYFYKTAEIVKAATGRDTICTEFGIDRGVLGEKLAGWRACELSAPDYAAQLRVAASRAPRCVRSMFIYCNGQNSTWQSFDVEGENAIRDVVNETWRQNVEFVLGFRSLADAMRARGLNPGDPLESEQPRDFGDGFVATKQKTTTGEMLWIRACNQAMFSGNDGKLIFYNGGNLIVTAKG